MMPVETSSPTFLPGMSNAYNQQLGLSQQNYGNILSGYQAGQQNIASQTSSIAAGYGTLSGQIANTLGVGGGGWGVAAPAAAQISRNYDQSQASNQQNLMNSGLGNSTLLSNVLNQGTLQANQAYGSLGAQLAQTYAGYQAQEGNAGLGARMQGLGMESSLTSSYLGDLAGFKWPSIPNMYGQASYANSPSGGGGTTGGAGQSGSQAQAGFDAYQAFNQNNNFGYSGAYVPYSYGSGSAPAGTAFQNSTTSGDTENLDNNGYSAY